MVEAKKMTAEEKIEKINAVLNDGPWTAVLNNSQETLITIVHILRGYRELPQPEGTHCPDCFGCHREHYEAKDCGSPRYRHVRCEKHKRKR